MKANPDKFQAIFLGKKTNELVKEFKIEDTKIECEDNVTLLGVNIDFMLNFSDHVSDICKKASKQLAVLKRIGKFLTKQGKLSIFNSFILSNFNYCPNAWHFCNLSSTKKMEKIQERALRFINDDFESPLRDLLTKNNRTFLHINRLKKMANEVYKIIHKLSPEYLQGLINIKISNYNFRTQMTANLPSVSTTRYGLKSFRYEAVRIWNSLPDEIRTVEGYPLFRRLLLSWDGPEKRSNKEEVCSRICTKWTAALEDCHQYKEYKRRRTNMHKLKVSPIAAFALTSPFNEPQNQTNSRELAESIRSSPLEAIIEHQNDEVTPSPRHELTSQEETQFLSSTPKPGKALSSRRRPVFYKEKPYTRSSPAKPAKLNLSSIPKAPTVPVNHRTRSGSKAAVENRPSSVTKATSNKRPKAPTVTENHSTTAGETTVTENRSTTAGEKTVTPDRTKSATKATAAISNKRQKATVRENHRETVGEKTLAPDRTNSAIKAASTTSNKRQKVSETRIETSRDVSIVVQSQSAKQGSATTKGKKVLSSTRTDRTVNKRQDNRVVQRRGRLQTSVVEESVDSDEDEENVMQRDVMMILWEKQGTKRKKSDFCDVDMVLNTFTELLETQLDVCDSQSERKAVQTLEKYLVKDITEMIDSSQTVKTIRTDARKTAQVLKQKQRTLMELQKKRLKAEEKAFKDEETTQSVQNRQTINRFLSDLKKVIAKC